MGLPELSLDLQLQLEAEFAPVVSAALTESMALQVEALRQGLPPVLPQASRKQIMAALTRLWIRAAEGSSRLLVDEFSTSFKHLERKLDEQSVLRQTINTFIDAYGARQAAQILQTTETQVRDLMNGGLRHGEAREVVLLELIEKIPNLADARSKIISRTEVHAMTQFASQKFAERSGKLLQKTWFTMGDDKVRDFGVSGRISEFNHRLMHGLSVSLNQSFLVPRLGGGLEPLLFPGDPTGSAGNIINCRCVQTYVRLD